MSTALAKHRATIQRFRANQKTAQAERHIAVAAFAGAIGWAEHAGHLPTAIMNVPSKLALGIGLTFVAMQARGTTARLANAGADAALATYAYAAAKSGAFIAGDDDEV